MKRPPAVARVLERVTATAREHQMFLPGQTVLVAVSGGPDSVCLLHALHQLRRLFKVKLAVFHFDHRLRPSSAKDAGYVRRLAARLKVPVYVDVAVSAPAKGGSVEAWARNERLRAMHAVEREIDAGRIAIAHTLDDQAESVLLAVLMGGGLNRVAGIKPSLGPFVQPLIDVTREEVEAFCRALRLRPRRDPTNSDTRFLRNALRIEALPALERVLGRPVREPLAQTAALLRVDADELGRQMEAAWDDVYDETPRGADLLAARLLELPTAIGGRLVSLAIVLCGSPSTKRDVDAVLDLAHGRPGRRRDLSYGLKASREREYVSLSRPSPESRDEGGRIGRPGRTV